ncbi:MAG: glycosyltransferase [Bacteroidales bacterium]
MKIHPNVILDFDDDIAASKREPREVSSLYGRLMLENGNKFSESLHLYPRFIVGSGYLKEYLLTRRPELSSDNVLVVPTCVDYERHASHYYPEDKTKRTLGWVGIPENLVQLDFLIPILNRLAESFTFELLIISSRPYQPEGALFEVVNLTWDWSHEIAYLQKIDVGLMPLEDTPAARGKCGFKLIQYMGLGIPAIGSAVTVNKEIIASKDMGWLVITPNEWENALVDALSMSPELLARMGARARLHVEKNYSFTANFENYKSFVSSE